MGILDKLFGDHKQEYETLGNNEPVCPYCAKPLDKMPGRKSKCSFCANYMYVRTRPADRKRVVVTEQDAAKIDAQRMVENGPFEGPPMSQAIEYARKHGDQIATMYELTPDSADILAQIIGDGIQNKRGIEGISRDIRAHFPDMSKVRSVMIAQTETNRALSKGMMQKMHNMNIDGKKWIGRDCCQICQRNINDGVIPIDQLFSSGDMETPAHPNCKCGISPARLNRKD